MSTLTQQQRNFLAQRLKVKSPQKKGFFSRASAEEKSDKQVTKDYGSLLDDIAKANAALEKLDGMAGPAPTAQAPVQALRAELAEVSRRMEQATEQDAAAVFKAQKEALAQLLVRVKAAVKALEGNPQAKARGDYVQALAEANRQLELLRVIPNARVQALSDLVATAVQAAAPDTQAGYRQAVTVLAACAPEFKSASAAAAKAQKADVAQSAKKPDALTALSAAAVELAALERLPGCEAAVTNFAKVLKDARKLADANMFADALDELKKLKSLPSLSDSEAASRKAEAGLQGNPGYDDALAALDKLQELVTPVEAAEHRKALQAAVKQALASKGGAPDLTPAAAALHEALKRATQAKAGLGALLASIENTRTLFGLLSSQAAIARVNEQRAAVDLAKTGKDFATASRLATELLGELTAGIEAREQPHADWMAVNDKPPLLVKEIDATREGARCEAVRRAMLLLKYKVTASEVQRLRDAALWSALVANVAEVEQGLVRARAMEADFAAFDTQRHAAAVDVQGLVAAARADITGLEAAVEKAGKAMGAEAFAAGAGFSARLDHIEKVWGAALASATSDAELKLEATRAALLALRKDIVAAGTPAAIQQSLNDHDQQLAQARFEADWAVVQAEIVTLQAVDNRAAAQAGAEADTLRRGGRADWRAAIGALAQLNSRVAAERAQRVQDRDRAAVAVAKTVKDVRLQIKALKDSTGSGKFGPFFETLQQECDQFDLLAKSPSGDAIAEAELGLQALLARIAKFMPGKATPASGPTLDEVAAALANSEKALKKIADDLTRNCPKTGARLDKQLVALRASLASQDPVTSMKAVEAFDASCVSAKQEAEKVTEVRNEYAQLLPSVQAALAAFGKRKAAPEYAAVLEGRLAEIVKQARDPDELYAAWQKLNALDEELKDAAINPAAALAKEGQIRANNKAAAAAQAEWTRSLELFEGQRLGDAQTAVKDGGAKGLIDELKNMLKAAKETAGKGDHAEALKQLQLADQRAGEIIAHPQGASIGARNNLPADAALYTKAVTALRELLGSFPRQVAAVMPTLPEAVAARLAERVSTLVARMDAAAFDTPVQQLIQPGIDDKERRALREAALAKVRSVRSLFMSHPLMASLAKSPVAAAELSASLRRVDKALNRLDANISRSCA